MKALIGTNNKIIEICESEFQVHPDLIWIDCPEGCEFDWVYENGQLNPPITPSIEELINKYKIIIEQEINNVAISKQYDSGVSCASYALSSNPKWKAEAQCFIDWRDLVWNYLYVLIATIEENQQPIPCIQQIINNLPIIQWPN